MSNANLPRMVLRISDGPHWIEIDIGKDTINLDYLIMPEQRLSLAPALP
jgi:hypothetical protein